jgi:uncharacterized membrane protein YdjX (TVP38/TMEM64 family)
MNEIPMVPENVTVSASPEALLGQILANQQLILENQNILLRSDKNRKIWGIIKIVFIALLVLVPLFFLPAIISSMMGGMLSGVGGFSGGGASLGGMNLDAILGNPDALEQLLMGQ